MGGSRRRRGGERVERLLRIELAEVIVEKIKEAVNKVSFR
jgi:hypothetical protein